MVHERPQTARDARTAHNAAATWRATVAESLPGRSATQSSLFAIRDPRIRGRLIGLVEQAHRALEDDLFDVVLLAARRMACLYTLMRENGLPAPARGMVVSDRFLRLQPTGPWRDKRVLVLDDTRVSGSTLKRRVDEARRLVGVGGTVRAAVAMDFEDAPLGSGDLFGGPPLRAEDVDHGHDLHNQFARAFSENLLPYFMDFPMSTTFVTTAERFDGLLTSPDWLTVDVTNSASAGSGSRAYSLFPAGGALALVLDALVDRARLVEILKLRVFSADDGSDVRVRVVPLVLAGSLREKSVRRCLAALGTPLPDGHAAAGQAAAALSFLLARAVFAALLPSLRDVLGADFEEDLGSSTYILGAPLQALVDGWSLTDGPDPLALLEPDPAAVPWQPGAPEFGWDPADEANARFLVLGDEHVFPSLDDLDRVKDGYAGAPGEWGAYASTVRRLAELTGCNPPAASLAVDVLNDLGYAVPGYFCKDDVVYRGYRPGEAHPTGRDRLPVGRLGGRLASVPHTLIVPIAQDRTAILPTRPAPRPVARATG